MFHCNTLKKEGRAFAFAFRNIGKYIPVLCNQPCQFSYSNLVNLRLLVSYLETWSHFLASPLPYYYYWSQTSVEMAFFLFRLLHTPLVPVADSKREVMWWQTSVVYRALQFAAQLLQIPREVASSRQILSMRLILHLSISTVTYLELCLARKCETRKTCKQTEDFPLFTHHMIIKFVITLWLFLIDANETWPGKKATSTDIWDQYYQYGFVFECPRNNTLS